jgi:4-amino-4-deoxy-L-arabinose transferase-like glycosyltransferase
MFHPTVFSLSRFGRPEIAVTALALLSSALAARAARLRAPRWAAAAGAAAALAFLMHQYGGLALVALGAAFLLRPPRTWRDIRPLALAAVAGALGALLPWLLWIGSDFPEFRAQLGAQLDYQRWRYPDASAPLSVLRDLPGRYLLNRQDYSPGWQPWPEAATLLLGPRFLQGPTEVSPLPLLRWGASVPLYWQQLGIGGLYRWGVLGALLLALTAAPLALRGNAAAMRWVLLPLLLWVVALAAIPNKWEGYTGPVAAYTAVALTLLLAHAWRARPAWGVRWPGVALVSAVALCAALWVAADLRLLTHSPAPYEPFAERLRQAVPPGEPVAISMREWFAFAGRNPAVTYEFRSVPAFRTSVLEMVTRQRPRYLLLHRTEGPPERERRYHFINPPWDDLYAYLETRTELVATVHDPWHGTVEVRRVREHPGPT